MENMNETQVMLLPCLAMVLLTLIIGLLTLYRRIQSMKKLKISPQRVATSAQKTELLTDTRASDNFSHLFELPVLFYVLCLLCLALQQTSMTLVILAWGFVVSRYIHSFIQCTYNKVMHRFLVFITGYLLVIAMLITLLIGYLL